VKWNGAERFARPREELRKQMKALGLDAATMAINVKTEIPAGVAVLGAARSWLGTPWSRRQPPLRSGSSVSAAPSGNGGMLSSNPT
jgi:hypothetical protein